MDSQPLPARRSSSEVCRKHSCLTAAVWLGVLVPVATLKSCSVAAAVFRMDGHQMAELAQPQAAWDTGITLSDVVSVVINGEKVAEAHLCTFEGRYAITIL